MESVDGESKCGWQHPPGRLAHSPLMVSAIGQMADTETTAAAPGYIPRRCDDLIDDLAAVLHDQG